MNEDDKQELKKLLGDYVFYAANYYEYKDEEVVEFIEQYAASVLHGFVGDLYREETK